MRQQGRVLACFVAVFVTLSFIVPAAARGQAKALGTDELTKKSDVVARGRVEHLRSQWVGNKERIETIVTVNVEEYMKGNPAGKTMAIVNPGGEVDGVGELYTHMARFKQDEDVVVFVGKDKQGRYRMTGGGQGKLVVKQDQATGKPVVLGQKTLDELRAEVKKAR